MSTDVIATPTATRRRVGEIFSGIWRSNVVKYVLFIVAVASILAIAFM